MFTFRRFRTGALLLPLAALAGCSFFMGIPGEPPARRGGFTVLVDGPGQPTAERVAADVGAFARERGFVRLSAGSEPDRYHRGDIDLETTYLPAEHRVDVSLHSAGALRDRGFIDRFSHDFHQEYARRYREADPVTENAYAASVSVSGPRPGKRA